MSRSLLVAGVVAKVAWIASLSVAHADSAVLGGGLVMGIVGIMPAAYQVIDRFLDRMMRFDSHSFLDHETRPQT